jgi:ubiquitin carboxyl-terminal hydrolase L3
MSEKMGQSNSNNNINNNNNNNNLEEQQPVDRLKIINKTVRENGDDDKNGDGFNEDTPWLALESNPEILNEFSLSIGMSKSYEFIDVLHPSLLPNPSNVFALVLLFPCTDEIYTYREIEQKEIIQKYGNGKTKTYLEKTKHLFFLEQVASFGNACGTIATLHVLCNLDEGIEEKSAIKHFKDKTLTCNPSTRGKVLSNTKSLKCQSDNSAQSDNAQTNCPDRDGPDLDHHFVAFIRDDDDCLFELDGTKFGPILHGNTSQETFVQDAFHVIQTNFMNKNPELIQFSVLALVKKI